MLKELKTIDKKKNFIVEPIALNNCTGSILNISLEYYR